MEPAKGLEPLTSGLRKGQPSCHLSHWSTNVEFSGKFVVAPVFAYGLSADA